MKSWDVKSSIDHRAVHARVKAMEALQRMNLLTDEDKRNAGSLVGYDYHALKRLLGYPTTMDDNWFCAYMTIQDVETCERLAGPHGYAIYKMLEARKRRRITEIRRRIKE